MIFANLANKPLPKNDALLEQMIEQAGLLQLCCSVAHMTGNLDILNGVKTSPGRFTGDSSGGIPEEQAKRLRQQALVAIKAWRDAGQPEPYRPSETELAQMLDFLVGSDLGLDYVPVVLNEMGYNGDSRRYEWPTAVSDAVKQAHPVLVIGAGMSGLLMAMRLKQAGIPVKVIEKNKGPGGTWYENRYPGCRVDVPSHAYSYSFMPDYKWPTLYSPQAELERHFQHFAERFELSNIVEWETEVIGATYDEIAHEWIVNVRGANGVERIERARSMISAVGQLNRARIPNFKGIETFEGATFHTSAWRRDIDLTGKRVIFIGAAATGVQAIPEVAKVAAHTTVFMRSPNWMSVHPEYTRAIRDGEQWAIEHLPYYAGWQRTLCFNWLYDKGAERFKIDPNWQPEPGKLSTSAANERSRAMLTKLVSDFLADTPELIEKMVPKYPPYMKRPTVIDGSFLRALQKDNVTLVTAGVQEVTPKGIMDNEGKLHEADVIVFATGFLTQKFLHPMQITGRNGINLNEFWGDEPLAYLGIMVPYFPNFYMMYGPNTNLGFNGTLIFTAECQAQFALNNIGRAIASGQDEVEVRLQASLDYDAKTQAELQQFVWTLEHTSNWFKNEKGRVTTNSPWSCRHYWEFTREPVLHDYLNPGEQNPSSQAILPRIISPQTMSPQTMSSQATSPKINSEPSAA